jgi:hypothetical protein
VLEGRINHDDTARVTLSFEGWKRYEELHAGRSESKKAFMAMPYGDDLVDRVFRECFKPAVARAGFELVRLDERPKAGLIDDRLRVEILTSRFLISDLTHGNHGAYWEAGFAEGKGKPVIYTCRRSYFDENGTHFDASHHLTVRWEPENLHEAAHELTATIRATLPAEAKMNDDD